MRVMLGSMVLVKQEAMFMVCAFARNRVAVHGPCFLLTMKRKETTFAILISVRTEGLCDTSPQKRSNSLDRKSSKRTLKKCDRDAEQ